MQAFAMIVACDVIHNLVYSGGFIQLYSSGGILVYSGGCMMVGYSGVLVYPGIIWWTPSYSALRWWLWPFATTYSATISVHLDSTLGLQINSLRRNIHTRQEQSVYIAQLWMRTEIHRYLLWYSCPFCLFSLLHIDLKEQQLENTDLCSVDCESWLACKHKYVHTALAANSELKVAKEYAAAASVTGQGSLRLLNCWRNTKWETVTTAQGRLFGNPRFEESSDSWKQTSRLWGTSAKKQLVEHGQKKIVSSSNL